MSITEVEDRIEKWVAKYAELQNQAVHKRFDVEMWVLAWPTPNADLTTTQAEIASLREDVYVTLEMMGIAPESAPTKLAEEIVPY